MSSLTSSTKSVLNQLLVVNYCIQLIWSKKNPNNYDGENLEFVFTLWILKKCRHNNELRNQRFCNMFVQNDIENEIYFILKCPVIT